MEQAFQVKLFNYSTRARLSGRVGRVNVPSSVKEIVQECSVSTTVACASSSSPASRVAQAAHVRAVGLVYAERVGRPLQFSKR